MWKYDLVNNTWIYVCGNQSIDVAANYDDPYPGGIHLAGMAMDRTDGFIYVFGGIGYDNSSGKGVLWYCIDF